jgi:hypothetical protein
MNDARFFAYTRYNDVTVRREQAIGQALMEGMTLGDNFRPRRDSGCSWWYFEDAPEPQPVRSVFEVLAMLLASVRGFASLGAVEYHRAIAIWRPTQGMVARRRS